MFYVDQENSFEECQFLFGCLIGDFVRFLGHGCSQTSERLEYAQTSEEKVRCNQEAQLKVRAGDILVTLFYKITSTIVEARKVPITLNPNATTPFRFLLYAGISIRACA